MPSKGRLERERADFNQRYAEAADARSLCIPEKVIQRYRECRDWRVYGKECAFALAKPLRGRDVLEIGCGTGTDSVLLAANGARVFAYEVSEQAVRVATRRVTVNGVSDRVQFRVAGDPLEAYPDRRFDLIFGNAVLHHLDLEGLGEHLTSVLRPGGACVFREPVVLSPWVGRLRRCIPWYPTNPTKDEQPLSAEAVQALLGAFTKVEVHPFECLSRLWYLTKSDCLIDRLHLADAKMFESTPWSRCLASVVVIRAFCERAGLGAFGKVR